ncbi:flagellar hook assembly protein FlgD [Croceicoccus sp. YJ47]|uniref:flagellar hook assembly protein FlgD n=1 Tax=Croceicoccus sp. YJ47 TaxID=2798724 RepID=UPI001921CBD4|nr:flagellar hook capping FlgD N-terminal domain-containing protein [Croceicoccus sp. YJ47]QQN75559.1 flagellar biosynthesis protein FlgD [Croceicoccus sp. YJ47]
MTVTSLNQLTAANNVSAATTSPAGGGFAQLGHADFLRLLMTQLQQQDPTDPADNKDMLAQMAQFSSLAGTNETNERLSDISGKLDALIAAQTAAS